MPCQKLWHLPTAEVKFECCVMLIQNMAFFQKLLVLKGFIEKQANLMEHLTILEQKRSFWPDLDLLGPNLGHKFFFGGFSSARCYTLSQAAIPCNIKEN